MDLSEFLTYCKLKKYLRRRKEMKVPDHDPDAEHYYDVYIQGRGYSASIVYATIGESACIVRLAMHDYSTGLAILNASFSDLKKAFNV